MGGEKEREQIDRQTLRGGGGGGGGAGRQAGFVCVLELG